MDEQTRQARFESMRRGPGFRKSTSQNKKLFVVHKDLERQCQRVVRRHEFDAHVVTSDLRRQQLAMQEKQERLKKQKIKVDSDREKTNIFLEHLQAAHLRREKTLFQDDVVVPKPRDVDIIRAIGKMAMPKAMKHRLQSEGLMEMDPGEVEYS